MSKKVQKSNLGTIGPINNNFNYNDQATDGSDLNDLDILMRTIVAFTHSSWKDAENVALQNITGSKTFAAVASGNTLYVAHNAGFEDQNATLPTDNELDQIADIISLAISDIPSYKLTKVTMLSGANSNSQRKSFHAEMQLLAYCHENNIQIDGGMMGVSKPCCKKCATQLTAQGIDFSLEDIGDLKGKWVVPDGYLIGVSKNSIYPI